MSGQVDPGLDQIGNAYQSLHQVTLRTLQDKARDWKETKAGDAGRASGDTTRGTSASPTSSAVTVRGEELLIAACPKGLLAGAPSHSPSTERPASPAGTPNDPSRPAQQPTDGQAVGMLLVCEHSMSGMSGMGSTPGERDAGTRPASASTGALKEGVYCVKRSGASVFLVDQQGQTVLRTTLDSKGAMGTPPRNDGGRGMDGTPEREPGVSDQRTSGGDEWGRVFGAIVEEAMRAMGWDKHHAGAATR